MATPDSNNLLLGAGMLYFDRFDTSGAKTGERPLGNCGTFTLNTTVEKVEKYSAMNKAKRLYKSVIKSIKATGKIVLDEFDPANLALALLGTEGTVTQTAGSVTAGTPFSGVAKKGYAFKLGHFAVSDVVVKDSTGTTTYTAGTDYEVTNAKVGLLTILAAGSIVDASTIKCEYSYGAVTMPKVSGATVGKIEGYLRFVGDPASGPAYLGDFWKVSVAPEGDLGWISDDFANFTLNIECQDDSVNHSADPMYRVVKL